MASWRQAAVANGIVPMQYLLRFAGAARVAGSAHEAAFRADRLAYGQGRCDPGFSTLSITLATPGFPDLVKLAGSRSPIGARARSARAHGAEMN